MKENSHFFAFMIFIMINYYISYSPLRLYLNAFNANDKLVFIDVQDRFHYNVDGLLNKEVKDIIFDMDNENPIIIQLYSCGTKDSDGAYLSVNIKLNEYFIDTSETSRNSFFKILWGNQDITGSWFLSGNKYEFWAPQGDKYYNFKFHPKNFDNLSEKSSNKNPKYYIIYNNNPIKILLNENETVYNLSLIEFTKVNGDPNIDITNDKFYYKIFNTSLLGKIYNDSNNELNLSSIFEKNLIFIKPNIYKVLNNYYAINDKITLSTVTYSAIYNVNTSESNEINFYYCSVGYLLIDCNYKDKICYKKIDGIYENRSVYFTYSKYYLLDEDEEICDIPYLNFSKFVNNSFEIYIKNCSNNTMEVNANCVKKKNKKLYRK